MDHKEEQQIEMETLLSIYADEMTVLSAENSDPEEPETFVAPGDERPQFTLKISSSDAAVSDAGTAAISTLWKIVFPLTYPEVPPEITLLESGELPDRTTDDLVKAARATALENIGMAVVFTVVSVIQDKLCQYAENCVNELKEHSERAKREEEEADRKKMEGTRVSVESFIAWKTGFDNERNSKKLKPVVETGTKRLTGRQMFQENANLDNSDQQFMEEGDEALEEDGKEGEDIDEDFDRELFEQELLNEGADD